jgi:hypothetical protein
MWYGRNLSIPVINVEAMLTGLALAKVFAG